MNNKVQKGYRETFMRILGDGEWHTFAQLFYAIEGMIAPEDAARKHTQDRSPKDEPLDVDAAIRDGKERTAISVLSGIQCEQQGFRNADRFGRKFRLRPEAMKGMDEAKAGARIAFRALIAQPAIRETFEHLRNIASGEGDLMTSLNPAQQYWIEFALSPEAPAVRPFEEEQDGDTQRSS